MLVEDPQRQCGHADTDVPTSGVVDRRIAALDAEIDGLSRLRAELALRAAGRP
ncbi:hypothetical protein [Streptomyces chartreusis]|uniref:hypothetical protein n=1 Tax=Streptomyces chartreusis TaxID=1969 RepID=UPI003F4CBA50